MELKIWVDDIQKVVCGVTYTTTCQDVVLALACALRQTGRFSLVEKWRDSERPLVPAECPLQSLHRLGEYAGEVRYYLIRAETGTAGQPHVVGQKPNVSASNMQRFRHNFTPPDKFHHYLHSPELIKRSSTFSGAHHSLDGAMSSSLPHSSQALPQQRCDQTLCAVTTVSASASYITSNGKPGGLSLNDVNSLSLRSRGRSGQNTSDSWSSKEASLQPQISSRLTFSEEAGKHRTAKMSSCHGHNFANSSSLPAKHNSPQRIYVDQPSQQTFHSNPGKAQQSVIESSQQYHPSSSSQCDHPVATSQLQQEKQYLSSQLPHESDKKPYPVPSPRHHLVRLSPGLVPESVPAHVRLKDTQEPHQRETLRIEHLQSISACVPHSDTNFARSVSSDGVEGINVISKVHANDPSQQSQGGPTLNHKPSSILRIAREHLQKNGNFQKLEHPADNSQGRATLKNNSESPSDTTADVIKYATLDRHFTRSKPHPALSTRSLSIGHGDEDRKPDNKPVIRLQPGPNDYLQHCAEEKASQVSKTQNSTNSSVNKKMSSFASAVAHIRQYNGNVGINKANIAHIRQHSEGVMVKPVNAGFHARQHSSDSSYTDNHLKGMLPQSADHVQPVDAEHRLGISDSNSKYKTSLLQSSMKPSLPFSFPPLLHNSAPTEVHRQSSYQDCFIAQSHSSAASKTFSENIQADRTGSVISSNKKQESSRSENVKLEESGCDQNFPHMSTKNAAKYKETNKNEKLDVSREVDTIDREYSQLLRTVEMLQERIRLQEAQINSSDLEITSIEEKEIRNKEKLQAILEEISSFEVCGAVLKEELDSLEKTEWISIIETEQELDASMNKQITSLKAKLELLESEIKQQNDEEEKNSQEIKSEEEREAQERKQNEEIEKQVTSEKEQLDEQLNNISKIINEKNLLLEHLEKEILEADKVLNQKEKEVKSIEEELKTEADMANCQPEVPSVFPARTSRGTFPVSDSGEAILKILECQLSAQSPPTSPFMDEVDNLGGITSAQHLYTLGSVKTHNGIWV